MQSIYLLDPNFAAKGSLPQHLVDLRDLGFDAGIGSTGSGAMGVPEDSPRSLVCHGKSWKIPISNDSNGGF